MASSDNPTAQKLLQCFMQIRRIAWHHRSVAGCKPSEVRVLFCIKKNVTPKNPEMKVSEISKRLQVTSPTITQLIKSLESDGLVERSVDPSDRRAVGIKLTKKGESVTRKAADAFAARLNGLIEYLGEEESDKLSELLNKVSLYFNQREAGLYQSPERGDDEI